MLQHRPLHPTAGFIVTILFALQLAFPAAHLSLAREPAAAATRSQEKLVVRAAEQCTDSDFFTGSRCMPCTECAVGTYTATPCSERQDAL